ncbi:MAG: hypothetical protein K0S33_946 [Bacteroidetes bacterium]|jgi:hypothetical protein|nr:hypothetical protein [Bacteroidota bacterium]
MKNYVLIGGLLLAFAACKKDKTEQPNPATPAVTPKWNEQFVGSYRGTWTITISGPGSSTTTTVDTTMVLTAGVTNGSGMTAGAIDSTNSLYFYTSGTPYETVHFNTAYRYEPNVFIKASLIGDSLKYRKGTPIGLAGSDIREFKGKKIQ